MGQSIVEVSRTVHAPADTVWRALTTPTGMKTVFFGADVASDWRVGSPITFRGEFDGKPYEDRGEIRSFEPKRRLAFSHFSPGSGDADKPENYNLVTFDLAPDDEETKVTLSQGRLHGDPSQADMKHREQFKKNWALALEGLARAVVD